MEEPDGHCHAYFAERIIRTIKEAMLRRIAAGAGRRGQWHLMLATQVAPNLAYPDPEMQRLLCATSGAGPSTRSGNQSRGYGSDQG